MNSLEGNRHNDRVFSENKCVFSIDFNFPIEIAVSMEDFDGLEAPYCTIAGLNDFLTDVPGLACSFDTGNFIMYQENELEGIGESVS